MAKTVQLFVTCLIDSLYPKVGEAVVDVLERCGVQIEFPRGQTCCGQPVFNAGMRREARRLAELTIRVLEATNGPVVIPSGSCAAMIRHHYAELFREDPAWLERAERLGKRVFELSEFLVDELGVIQIEASFNGKITYHSSCHLLRGLGIDRQPRLLLKNLEGAEFIELDGTQECCGFGGVFSVEHPELSSAMLERKLANIQATQADAVVACDAGCITHINGGLHRRGLPPIAVHIAQILAGTRRDQSL